LLVVEDEAGRRRSHDCILEKPYEVEDLARTIREMLEARLGRAAARCA
jgi:hypothetical protein